jgi:hypothetical protein
MCYGRRDSRLDPPTLTGWVETGASGRTRRLRRQTVRQALVVRRSAEGKLSASRTLSRAGERASGQCVGAGWCIIDDQPMCLTIVTSASE